MRIQSIKALAGSEPNAKEKAKAKRARDKARRFGQFHELCKYLQASPPQAAEGERIIVVPLPPNLLNPRSGEGSHWRQRELKSQYQAHLQTLQATGLLPRPPQEPPPLVSARARFYLDKLMDSGDNLGARLKWPLDFLNQAGWMVDDGPEYLQWEGTHVQELAGKTPQRIEITVRF